MNGYKNRKRKGERYIKLKRYKTNENERERYMKMVTTILKKMTEED